MEPESSSPLPTEAESYMMKGDKEPDPNVPMITAPTPEPKAEPKPPTKPLKAEKPAELAKPAEAAKRGSVGGAEMQEITRYPRYEGTEFDTAEHEEPELTFAQNLYDGQEGLLCRRTPVNCCLLLGYYLALYMFLAAFFMLMFFIHTQMYPEGDKPRYSYHTEGKHPYLNSPGLTTVPTGGIFVTKVHFNPLDESSWTDHVKDIDNYLRDYQFKTYSAHPCSDAKTSTVCRLNRTMLGDCDGVTDPTYGYSTGEPCVLFRVNKIIGWQPERFASEDSPNSALITQDRFDRNFIPIACEVFDPENCNDCLGMLDFYPTLGFDMNCFPYCGYDSGNHQEGPVQMIKFKDIKKNKKMLVWCAAYADNIVREKLSQQGGKIFSLRLDG